MVSAPRLFGDDVVLGWDRKRAILVCLTTSFSWAEYCIRLPPCALHAVLLAQVGASFVAFEAGVFERKFSVG